MTTPCTGLSWLFDSIHPLDHIEARKLCATCPVTAWCDSRRDRWSEGTWAGRLYGANAYAMRRLREEQMFNEAEARAAHARFWAGERDDHTLAGERVYQRRNARKNRTRVA